ncbi:MAG: XdhC family protein [Novosphingobium sp.]
MGQFDSKAYHDHMAVIAATDGGTGLCTIVGIDGGFSRRIGAQLAILPDGNVVGSLADGCLEQQLASDLAALDGPRVNRYGTGSPFIDFRLPCGGGLDILLDPAPDRQACRKVADDLAARRPAALNLPPNPFLNSRKYIPQLALDLIGSGPELECLAELARAAGLSVRVVRKDDLSLGSRPQYPVPDRWTATVLLFHDHEWEAAILAHALSGNGFYVGAQGGHQARVARIERLREAGLSEVQTDRIKAPIGVIPSCREPDVLAVSILADIYAEYEKLREA